MSFPAFRPEELQIVGRNSPPFAGMPQAPKFNTPITPKENWRLVIEGKKPCWMPFSTDIQGFRPRIIPDNVVCGLVVDGGAPLGVEDYSGKGWFDTEWVYVPLVGGATVKPGAPQVEDINDWPSLLRFPDIDAYDWEASAAENQSFFDRDRPLEVCMLCGFWERLISLMDVANAAVALIDEDQKDGVHSFFDALCGLYDRVIDKYHRYYQPELILMHDDWGTQNAPFFSTAVLREMILPYIKRVVDSCHRRGIRFELHSCGRNEPNVPCMIEAGVDMWCGQTLNDTTKLMRQYGDKLLFFAFPDPIPAGATEGEIVAMAEKFFDLHKDDRAIMQNRECNETFMKTVYQLSREYYAG